MQQYKSKVDVAYEYILGNLSNRIYLPGERLIISQISKQCGVSDIPVREAIRRLESEGYVYTNANQGAVASPLDQDSLTSVFHIKGVLEGYATRISVDYLTPNDIKKLRAKNSQIQKAFDDHNIKKYSQLNMQFHLQIYQSIPQKEYYNLISDLWKKWSITKSVFSLVPQRIEASIHEHEDIISLIEQKKYDEVEECVRNHKFQAGYEMTKLMEDKKNEAI